MDGHRRQLYVSTLISIIIMDTSRFSDEGFDNFIQELIDGERFSDSMEVGIAKLVVDKGFEALSPKQKAVFEKSISFYAFDKCRMCGGDIPWAEMSTAENNGQLCSWCENRISKDD